MSTVMTVPSDYCILFFNENTANEIVNAVQTYALPILHTHLFFFFQAEDGIRDLTVTGVQTCALPIYRAGVLARRLARPGQEQLPRHPAPPAAHPGPAGLDRVRGGALPDQPAPRSGVRRTPIRNRAAGGAGGARQGRGHGAARARTGAVSRRLPRGRDGGGRRLGPGAPGPLAPAVPRGPTRAGRAAAGAGPRSGMTLK